MELQKLCSMPKYYIYEHVAGNICVGNERFVWLALSNWPRFVLNGDNENSHSQ